jgi:hypothetical protein
MMMMVRGGSILVLFLVLFLSRFALLFLVCDVGEGVRNEEEIEIAWQENP